MINNFDRPNYSEGDYSSDDDSSDKDKNIINQALEKTSRKVEPVNLFISDDAFEEDFLRTSVEFLEYKITEFKDPELIRLIQSLIYACKDKIIIKEIYKKHSKVDSDIEESLDESYDSGDLGEDIPKEHFEIVGYISRGEKDPEFYNNILRKEQELDDKIRSTVKKIQSYYPNILKVLEQQRETFINNKN